MSTLESKRNSGFFFRSINVGIWLIMINFSAAVPLDSGQTISREMIEAAMSGSGDAALTIAQFASRETANQQTHEKWLLIAAENGNPTAQHAYAQILWASSRGDKINRIRARYWAKRAADQGFESGKKLLDYFDRVLVATGK
jgi:TPR repeat protein